MHSGSSGRRARGFRRLFRRGKNNFCIHYYSYTGRAQEGDLILNDVGAQHDNMIADVFACVAPCGGKFTDRQKCFTIASPCNYRNMHFSRDQPGMPMAEVDAMIRRFNAERLVEAGVLASVDEIGKLMWHAGAHHIGYDVHDMVKMPRNSSAEYGILR